MGFSYTTTGRAPLAFRLTELPVFFADESCLDMIHQVLAEDGSIRNFPGIAEDARWRSKHRIGMIRDVRFEAQFYPIGGSFLMLWLLQPNGWYWVDDDGFGFSGDSSIMLWSVIDEQGRFTREFSLFSIDSTRYCHDFDAYL